MAKTHNFEIQTANISTIQGQLNFDSSEDPSFSTTNGVDIEEKEAKCLIELFKTLRVLQGNCGKIINLELTEIP